MPSIIIPPGWRLPDREATPFAVFQNRREFLKGLGILGLGALGVAAGHGRAFGKEDNAAGGGKPGEPSFIHNYDRSTVDLYPAARNAAFTLDRALTEENVAAKHNNFYEFTTDKGGVWSLVDKFKTAPWSVEIAGLCEKPGTYDVYDLIRKMPREERLYRHRCVEAWAMAVPWTGFPLAALLDYVGVKSKARYVRFVSFKKPDEAPGQRNSTWYNWPYYEGLRMDEARNELAFLATGIYGHPLPKQHGAPLRLVTPWKYGFKSAKSIVRIEFTQKQPRTFWNDAVPDEYGFLANVEPQVPHPRWSQASEMLIGTGQRVPTQKYNGYGEHVARMYA